MKAHHRHLLPRDGVTKSVNFTKKLNATLGSKAEWNNDTLELLLRGSTIQWCSEGSKASEGIGAGIGGPNKNFPYPWFVFRANFNAGIATSVSPYLAIFKRR